MNIDVKKFQKILSIVKIGLGKKDIVEQSTHFLFTGKSIATYNDKMCVSYPFETDFSCSVMSEDFLHMVNGIEDNSAELMLENGELKVTSLGTKFGIAVSTERVIFDLLSSLSLENLTWCSLPSNFIEGVYACMFATSKVQTRDYLSCVAIQGKFILASDDVRVSKFELIEPVQNSFLLPVLSAVELCKFKPECYSINQSWVHFKDKNGVILSSRIIEGEFPDVSTIFEVGTGINIELPKDVSKVMKSLLVMVEGESILDKSVIVTLSNDRIVCRSQKEYGWLEKEVPTSYSGSPIKFMVNPIFLSDVLGKANKVLLYEDRALFTSDNFQHIMALPVGE